ncbi:MAG: hypothetical protein IJM72_01090 [Deltaproteobacteria bacterium]|nr:hypothetical protein [Deltaproteobacteria bacterium]
MTSNNAVKPLYPHSLPQQPEEQWQTLDVHLEACTKLTRDFAVAFGSAPWGDLLDDMHNVGKARKFFQKYLSESIGSTGRWQ